jgi:hypothetical protein
MKTLREELNAPLPQTRTDWQGKPQPINYPKGTILARCGEALLIQCNRYHFAVVYGLQVETLHSRTSAIKSFGECCLHQAACEGLAIE